MIFDICHIELHPLVKRHAVRPLSDPGRGDTQEDGDRQTRWASSGWDKNAVRAVDMI